MSKERGITLPSTLIRPTPPEPPADDQAEPEGQGGEPAAPEPRPRARRKRTQAAEKIRGHKLALPDSVFARLELHAIKRGSTASAIAAEILDRQLPRHRIVTDD